MSSASASREAARVADGPRPPVTKPGAVLALVAGSVVALLAAELALRVAMPHWREFWSGWFVTTDAAAGVAVGRAGYDGYFAQNNGDFRVRIRINESGLRDPAPAATANGQIWAVGDSMTFGWGVEIEQSYAKLAERALGRGVYNLASPGADVMGYEALIKRMPEGVRPAAVVVGLVLENDLAEYRAAPQPAAPASDAPAASGMRDDLKIWLTTNSALYNFFATALKRSDAIADLLIRAGLVERAQGYRYVFDSANVDALVASTAEELANLKRLLPDGAPLAVLVVPGRFEIRDRDPIFRGVREKMLAALAARGIEAIDVFDRFAAAGFVPTHFIHDGHWNARGHEIAGQAVAAWLGTKGLTQ